MRRVSQDRKTSLNSFTYYGEAYNVSAMGAKAIIARARLSKPRNEAWSGIIRMLFSGSIPETTAQLNQRLETLGPTKKGGRHFEGAGKISGPGST